MSKKAYDQRLLIYASKWLWKNVEPKLLTNSQS